MVLRTEDPVSDFLRHDEEQNRWLESLPECADCGEPIQADHFFLINDEAICPDCLESNYRKENTDYIF